MINFRENWRGHLWQERFASFPMNESYLLAVARYVEMNPVAAGLVLHPGDYPWSSACAHLAGTDDQLAKVAPLLDMVDNWREFLYLSSEEAMTRLRQYERSGRPLGNDAFVTRIEKDLARILHPLKRGPKPMVP